MVIDMPLLQANRIGDIIQCSITIAFLMKQFRSRIQNALLGRDFFGFLFRHFQSLLIDKHIIKS